MQADTLIVGGGLSGLSLAYQLTMARRSFVLVEARGRFGGRILTEECDGGYFDLGPSWFWPGQARIARVVSEFGLNRFDQHYTGDLIFEDEGGQVQRVQGMTTMQGSFRLEGGIGALVNELVKRLPEKHLKLGTKIATIKNQNDGILAVSESGHEIMAKRVVLALPPRVAAQITYEPALPSEVQDAMKAIPTWMAGQAKVVSVYEHNFWREAGLSGDAMSRAGPMIEIHDASPADNGPCALFGFVGVAPHARRDQQVLRQQAREQLVRLFGARAADPKELYVKDWAFDPCTSTTLDLQPLYAHPAYGMPKLLKDLWQGRVVFGGSEVATQFGGYLEGALEAAEHAFKQIAL